LSLHEGVRLTIGASHAEIGGYLLGLWGLPHTVVEAVSLHYTPQAAGSHGFDLLCALAVSHSVLGAQAPHPFAAGLASDPGVGAEYLALHEAPFDWEEACRRVQESLPASHQP
jgi:hypothetical protein